MCCSIRSNGIASHNLLPKYFLFQPDDSDSDDLTDDSGSDLEEVEPRYATINKPRK